MNMGIKLGEGSGGAQQEQDEGELIKGKRLLPQAGILLWLPQGGRRACFSAVDLQQEAHRGNSGESPLSKCDGHFTSQRAFSSLAHAGVPPPTTGCKAHPVMRPGRTLESHPPLLNCS